MKKILSFCLGNKRFVSAVAANVAALFVSIWWLADSNIIHRGDSIEIEPIVSTISLFATLLGLSYVNEKIGKPILKFNINQSIAKPPGDKMLRGMSIELQNHSIYKCHIRRFYFTLPVKKSIYQLLRDGFTRDIIKKFSLEPGQSFSFNIERSEITRAVPDLDNFGELVVEDDVGRTYLADSKHVKENLRALYRHET